MSLFFYPKSCETIVDQFNMFIAQDTYQKKDKAKDFRCQSYNRNKRKGYQEDAYYAWEFMGIVVLALEDKARPAKDRQQYRRYYLNND
jgi:hypothetical protein